MSFGQNEVSIDGFDRSFCFMVFGLDMTSSEAGHRPVWSYVLRSSYVRCRDIRVALVLERRWHILCLSKHRCLWTRPLPYFIYATIYSFHPNINLNLSFSSHTSVFDNVNTLETFNAYQYRIYKWDFCCFIFHIFQFPHHSIFIFSIFW